MKAIPFVNEGLGNSSYVVDLGNGKAIVVDPDRTVQRYLDALAKDGLETVGIFETHLHADFVSGGRELAARTGAPIFIAKDAQSRLPHQPLTGGEALALGGVEVTAVASPGHTPEHLSYVCRTASGLSLLFSGGSLIVGGAARSDLISPDMTDSLTRAQFRTVHAAFAGLPDETLLYPTHGGGSFCSTGGGQERTSTLGRERRDNPVLSFDSEDEFAKWFPTTFPAAPDYFFRLRAVNQAGPRLVSEIARPQPLSVLDFEALMAASMVIDGRDKADYARGHIPGSLSDPLRDDFAVWLGWLVPENTSLLFVDEAARIGGLVDQSLLVGYEKFGGWLKGGVAAWEASGRELARSGLVDASTARRKLVAGAASLDVREPDEYVGGHIEGAIHIPLGGLATRVQELPSDRPVVVYCGHGERASTAVSLLERAGMRDLVNVDGGIDAWKAAGFTVAYGD